MDVIKPLYCIARLIDINFTNLFVMYFIELHCLLRDEVVSHPLAKEDLMISEEVSLVPSSAPPDSCLISAQVEGTTLTRAQYNSISSLTSSLLCLPTGALVYVGHTSNPLTLHWHCTTGEKGEIKPHYSTGLLSEMAHKGIRMITVGTIVESVIPHRNVSTCS